MFRQFERFWPVENGSFEHINDPKMKWRYAYVFYTGSLFPNCDFRIAQIPMYFVDLNVGNGVIVHMSGTKWTVVKPMCFTHDRYFSTVTFQ